PKPNANGCTAAYPNLYALIDAINNGLTLQPNGSGVIWVEMGPDNSPNNIVIDGSVLGIWANNELTLQGGWDGVIGSTNILGTSDFTDYIHVINWKNTITV